MSVGRFSTFKISTWMDDMEATPKWLTLVSADPHSTANPYTAEITGTTLVRMKPEWTRTGSGMLTMSSAVVFTDLPKGCHVAGVAGFDAPYNGNLLFSDLLDAPIEFPNGGTFPLPAGEYVIGIDVPGGA